MSGRRLESALTAPPNLSAGQAGPKCQAIQVGSGRLR